MVDERTGVLVVGAGLAGAATALFLARRGVDVLLVERHQSTSSLPKATLTQARCRELLAWAGVALPEHATQDVVEPLLVAAAEQAGASVRFGTEAVGVRQDPTGVTARLLTAWNGRLGTVRAAYVVAADGHRSPIRAGLGIRCHGHGVLRHSIEVVYLAGEHAVRTRAAFDYHPERGESMLDFTSEVVADLIRLAAPEPAVRVEAVQAWQVGASVADRFADGRVFLAGDAARVAPPGGHCADIAVEDAYDLAWRLADVVDGTARPDALAGYDAERRPVAEREVRAALHELDRAAEPAREPEDDVVRAPDVALGQWTLAGAAEWRAAGERLGAGFTVTGGDGARLVRPDGMVAWQGTDEAELRSAWQREHGTGEHLTAA